MDNNIIPNNLSVEVDLAGKEETDLTRMSVEPLEKMIKNIPSAKIYLGGANKVNDDYRNFLIPELNKRSIEFIDSREFDSTNISINNKFIKKSTCSMFIYFIDSTYLHSVTCMEIFESICKFPMNTIIFEDGSNKPNEKSTYPFNYLVNYINYHKNIVTLLFHNKYNIPSTIDSILKFYKHVNIFSENNFN